MGDYVWLALLLAGWWGLWAGWPLMDILMGFYHHFTGMNWVHSRLRGGCASRALFLLQQKSHEGTSSVYEALASQARGPTEGYNHWVWSNLMAGIMAGCMGSDNMMVLPSPQIKMCPRPSTYYGLAWKYAATQTHVNKSSEHFTKAPSYILIFSFKITLLGHSVIWPDLAHLDVIYIKCPLSSGPLQNVWP